MHGLVKDLKGKVFSRLTVIKFDRMKNGKTYWIVQCKCKNVISVLSSNLVSGHTRSCGCLKSEVCSNVNKIHGLEGTRFYKIWQGMKQRCLNLDNPSYPRYGGIGIKVCTRWIESFENFRDDLYSSYLKHIEKFGEKDTTIDRWPNVSGNYEPGNVRWATLEEQARNKRNSSLTINYDQHIYWKHKLFEILNSTIRENYIRSRVFKLYIGCTLLEFKVYIESFWLPGMTWNNRGNGKNKWQLDHFIGCNNFDLSKEEDRKACFHYTNLRPMWDKDHKKKNRHRLLESEK